MLGFPDAPHPAESINDTVARVHAVTAKGRGVKLDEGKSRPDLIPGNVLLEVGKVLAYGAAKYTPDGWKDVPNARERYRAALMRHFLAAETEANDPESGHLHVAHVAVNALILIWFALRSKEL